MFLFQLTCLLFGLFATVSNAQNRWNGWRLDAGCAEYRAKLDEAYKDAALLASKASFDLGQVIDGGGEEPERLPHIRRAFTTMFGYRFQDEGPITAEDHPVKKIKANFDKVRDALGQGIITPPNGYHNIPGGPLFQCGVGLWQKHLADQPDPDNPDHPVKERDPVLANAPGAWFHEHRFVPMKNAEERDPWFCNDRNLAITSNDLDLLTLCFFNYPWWETNPSLDNWVIEEGKRTELSLLRQSLPATILHELMHWFSIAEHTETNDQGEQVTIWKSTIVDQPCFDYRGWYVYMGPRTTLRCRRQQGGNLPMVTAYDFKCATNLARFHPDLAINNADSYAVFALMLFFSDWGWNYGKPWYHHEDYDSVAENPDEGSWRTPGGPNDVDEDNCAGFTRF